MNVSIIDLIDFDRINSLLEGFNKSTGFVTAILDLEGKVLSKSGWRNVCVDFHRVNPQTSQKCHISDTVLASKMASGEKYHFYRCHNGLIDVAVPIIINGNHIANLFSGQFFFEPPDLEFFIKQARRYHFDEEQYLQQVKEVPIVNEDRVKVAMDFLLNMTEVLAEMTMQRLEQLQLNETLQQNQQLMEAQNQQLQHAKEKAEQSDQMHSSILHTSMDGFWLVDTKLNFVEVNDAYSKMSGYSIEELLTMKVLDVEANETPEETRQHIGKIREMGFDRFITKHRRKDGSTFDCEVTVQYKPFVRGELVVFLRDITESKKAEEALRHSEKELRTLAESMPQIVWITRPDGKNIYFNQQWISYTGLSLEESYGDGWIIPFHPDDKEKAWRAWQNAVNNNGVYSVECRLRRHDGLYRWWLIRGIPVLDDNGNLVKWFGTCTDIQEIKEAEVQIRVQLDELRRWHEVTIDREDRILELKNEVNDLLTIRGLRPRYGSNSYLADYEQDE